MTFNHLLDCHSKGLHSFIIDCRDGLYRRVFYATYQHNLWKPGEIAIHPHHTDITITVLEGKLYNILYELTDDPGIGIAISSYQWQSHIGSGSGAFKYVGPARIRKISCDGFGPGEQIHMKACELHTVEVDMGQKCVWLIEESIPSCEYFPINYSIHDLTRWTPDGLYNKCDDATAQLYLEKYQSQIMYTTHM